MISKYIFHIYVHIRYHLVGIGILSSTEANEVSIEQAE